jgi:hypothetical protein
MSSTRLSRRRTIILGHRLDHEGAACECPAGLGRALRCRPSTAFTGLPWHEIRQYHGARGDHGQRDEHGHHGALDESALRDTADSDSLRLHHG